MYDKYESLGPTGFLEHTGINRARAHGGGDGSAGESWENRVAQAFVSLADTIVDEFDLAKYLHTLVEQCVDLLEVSAAGVLLADQRGGVRLAAASSEKAALLEQFSADTLDGPSVECLHTGQPTGSVNLAAETDRWPRFAAAAELCGFGAAQALPMRRRRHVLGALSLFNTVGDSAPFMSAQLGQALADVATIGILQHRAITQAEALAEQLQAALTTRVVIEQAKGMLAVHSRTLTPEQAFVKLRGYARTHRLKLANLAHDIIAGTAPFAAILAHASRRRDRGWDC